MRVLLDENLPHTLRRFFDKPIEVITVGYKGWQGKAMNLMYSSQWMEAFPIKKLRGNSDRYCLIES